LDSSSQQDFRDDLLPNMHFVALNQPVRVERQASINPSYTSIRPDSSGQHNHCAKLIVNRITAVLINYTVTDDQFSLFDGQI
jgi:hypothetical protein